MIVRTEAELRLHVRETCQLFGKIRTGEIKGGLRDWLRALAAEHDAIVALRRLLKRKYAMSRSQIEAEVLACRTA